MTDGEQQAKDEGKGLPDRVILIKQTASIIVELDRQCDTGNKHRIGIFPCLDEHGIV